MPEFHTDVGAGSAAPNGKLPLHFEKKQGTMFFPPLLLANIEEKVIFLAWKQNEILSIYPRVLVKGMICLEIKVRSISFA